MSIPVIRAGVRAALPIALTVGVLAVGSGLAEATPSGPFQSDVSYRVGIDILPGEFEVPGCVAGVWYCGYSEVRQDGSELYTRIFEPTTVTITGDDRTVRFTDCLRPSSAHACTTFRECQAGTDQA